MPARVYLVDVAAIAALTALAALGTIPGHDAVAGILLVVVGRLRPPNEAPAPAANVSGVISILVALGGPILQILHRRSA